jgi:hypothetical protein
MRLHPAIAATSILLLAAGCERRDARETANAAPQPLALAVRVLADSSRVTTLPVRAPRAPAGAPPAARAWLTTVTPARADLPSSPLPEPDAPEGPLAPPPMLAVEPGLLPPVLRDPAALVLRAPRGTRPASVELDVRVDEAGDVSDAMWAGGSQDSALVHAAIECALGMRFWPARRGDDAVAVWCRQRFDFAR